MNAYMNRRPKQNITPRVLVVEDNYELQYVYSEFFKRSNIDFDLCDNRTEAVRLLQKRKYTLAILDAEFPDKKCESPSFNLHKLLDVIKNNMVRHYQRPYILIISGLGREHLSMKRPDKNYANTYDGIFCKPLINWQKINSSMIQFRNGLSCGRRQGDNIRLTL